MDVKPCPFCGSLDSDAVIGSNIKWAIVRCNDCEARSGEVRRLDYGHLLSERDKESAYAEWNLRFVPEHCVRPEGCVCGGDTAAARESCGEWRKGEVVA